MKTPVTLFTLLFFSASLFAASTAEITSQPFGKAENGAPVDIYTLRNASGMEARITNYGGIIVSLKVPDRTGKMADVVLGYDKLDDYIATRPFFGSLIGRYANRIAGAQFDLDGKHYQLGGFGQRNILHGGEHGFDNTVWIPRIITTGGDPTLQLTYVSKDGEEGFPGNLTVTAIYTLTGQNELRLDFTATTDKPTIVNFTNHTYFNLMGQGEEGMLDHVLMINADKFTPINPAQIPTGELRSVGGTPFDFRKPAAIGSRINDNDEQLKFGRGYDHNYVINKKLGELGLMAKVVEPKSGRVLEVLSTEPGMQLYSGNSIYPAENAKDGKSYHNRCAFALECEHFPDSANHPDFPSTVLRPGETFKSTIIFRFSTE